VLLPLDQLGTIIEQGSLDKCTWFPFEPCGDLALLIDDLRQWGARLQREWKPTCGWFHSHFLDGDDIGRIFVEKHGAQEPYFDRTWWSFLNDFFIPSKLRTFLHADTDAGAQAVAKAIAHTILRFGMEWLGSDHRLSQGRLRDFLNDAVDRLSYQGVTRPKIDELTPERQSEIYGNLKPRVQYLLPDSSLPTGDRPLAELIGTAERKGTLEIDQEKCPERPTLLGAVPYTSVGAFRTIDRREIESFRSISSIMRDYLRNTSILRPLSLGVFGPAGSGKTFIVEEIMKSAERIGRPTDDASMGGHSGQTHSMNFNLSQFESVSLLTEAFEEIQDVGLRGKTPLIFWDEYDSALEGRALGWLAYFLGPMNDGN